MKPVLQALLVADRVYEDKATGKKVVAGIFRQLHFKKPEDLKAELEKKGLPGNVVLGGLDAGSPWVYASLTDVRGTQPLGLRYVSLDEDKVVFETQLTVSCGDPLATLEIVAPLPKLPTARAGTYALELVWNDEPLGAFRIIVKEFHVGGPSNDATATD